MGDMYTNPPQSRNEAILRATIDGTEYKDPPQSRIEDLLLELKEAIEEGGGSVESYEQLTNKPQINGTTLSGDKSTEDLIPIDKGLEFDSDGKLAVSLGDGLAFNSDGEIDNLTEANPSDSATGELSKLKVGSDIYSVVTKAVNDLTNYYTKSEVYTKTEVNNIAQARFAVVAELPTQDIQTNVIYLVPKSTAQTNNDYDEYIYALKSTNPDTYGWEKIGDTEIDLSDYVTTQALNTALADYTTTTDLTTLLAGKEPTISVAANRALVSDANGKVSASSATSEEVGYLSGVTGAIQTQINGKADENEATPVSVSGNPITITDAANIPCESLSMTIEPIQSGSGTPSPTNVRPISGLTEANVNDGIDVWDGNSSYTINKSGYLFARGIPVSQGKNYEFIFDCADPKGQYAFEVFKNSTEQSNIIVNESGYVSEKNKVTFTISESATTYIGRLYTNSSNGLTVSNIVLNEIANSATITFGETVYGGNVDFESGKVVISHGFVDIGSLNFDAKEGTDDCALFRTAFNSIPNPLLGNINYVGTSKCSCFKYDSGTNVVGLTPETINMGYSNSPRVRIATEYYKSMTIEEFKTAMSGQKLCYELATPTELTLTPAQLTLLKGYNTVTANGATINLDYQKDNLAGDIKKWVTSLESKVPQPPTTDGTYKLTVTVASGEPTYSWESAT